MPNINLAEFRAPGVYTREIENVTGEDVFQGLIEDKLIVGFSRRGPFNTVTRIDSVERRREVYGEIDTFLEKRGSFFHRSIDVALQSGPVLAINLLPLDNTDTTGDKVDFQSFSTSPATKNTSKIQELLSSFYEKEKLWRPSVDNFISIVDSYVASANSILSFTNLGQTKQSVLVKKAATQPGFDILAKDYYQGVENVPSFIDPNDNISEYFVDVFIVRGDFSDFNALAVDPIYSRYFDTSGLKASSVASLSTSSDFDLILSVTGSIIPDLVDGSGTSYSIDTLINSYTSRTGTFCAINDDYLNSFEDTDFTEFDIIGHSLADDDLAITDIDFLSYKFKLIENLEYIQKSSFTINQYGLADASVQYENTNATGNVGLFSNRIRLDGTTLQANIVADYSLIEMDNGGKFAKIKNFSTSSGNTIIGYTHPDKTYEGSFGFLFDSSNVSANTVTIKGVHDDFGYGMTNEYVYATDGFSKYYFNISSYSVDYNGKKTTLTFDSPLNINQLNGNYKFSWSAGYPIIAANSTANTVTMKGYWDMSEFVGNFTGNVIYAKTNSSRTGNVTFTSHSIDANNDTVLTLSSALVEASNGATVNLVSSSSISQLLDTTWNITFGSYAITKPVIASSNANLVHIPDITNTITANVMTGYVGSTLYRDWANGTITSGDSYYKEVTVDTVTSTNRFYTGFEKLLDRNGIDTINLKIYEDQDLTTDASTSLTFGNKKLVNGSYEDMSSTEFAVSSKIGNINKRIEVNTFYDNATRARIPSSENDNIKIGDYVATFVNSESSTKYFLSPVLTKKKVEVGGTIFYDITFQREAKIIIDSGTYYIERYTSIDDFAQNYNMISLNGFLLQAKHMPGTKLTKQTQLEAILNTIENTGLNDALSDRNLVDYRYIVDTFESTVQNQTTPKDVLTRLAQKHQKSIALINAPSVKSFVDSTAPNPIFTTFESGTSTRVFKPEFIASGGNLELSPDFFYSFPTEANGSKYGMFFGPHLRYRTDIGTTISFPPSAHVSNLFVNKIGTGDQFKIAAGTNRGFIVDPSVIGLEYEFVQDDLGEFEKIGYNAIINKRGYGIVLYGNNTSYQNRISPLNKGHVRDNLNIIEREIDFILEKYLFDQNTPRTRFDIKRDLEDYLYGILNTAIYSFNVIIDENNNTRETISQSFGIVDVFVEPVMGMEKFINQITINAGSGVTASGFNF